MKRIAIFTSALLLICGMTGCGKSSGGTAVYTDIDIHDENIIRHCIEQPADDPQPDSWLYTEIVSGDPVRLRYITSTETVGDSEEGTDAAGETVAQPVEIDVFEGAEIVIKSSDYPRSISAKIQGKYVFHESFGKIVSDDSINSNTDEESGFKGVKAECSVISATPSKLIVRATVDENATALTEHNYKPKEVSKDFEIEVSEIGHVLLRNDEITPEIESELNDGMAAEITDSLTTSAQMAGILSGEPVQVPAVSVVSLYTILPQEDWEFVDAPKTSSIGVFDLRTSTDHLNYGVYAVLKDDQGVYYAATAYVTLSKDGSLDITNYTIMSDTTLNSEFSNFESAYACIEANYKIKSEYSPKPPLVLTEFKTYTDTTSEQQETAESTDAE